MKHWLLKLLWATLLVVGLPWLYLSTQTTDWELALIGKLPMALWALWTYDILTGKILPEHLKNMPTCSICGLRGHWITWVSDKNAWRCINHVYDEEPKEKHVDPNA